MRSFFLFCLFGLFAVAGAHAQTPTQVVVPPAEPKTQEAPPISYDEPIIDWDISTRWHGDQYDLTLWVNHIRQHYLALNQRFGSENPGLPEKAVRTDPSSTVSTH